MSAAAVVNLTGGFGSEFDHTASDISSFLTEDVRKSVLK